MGNLNSSKNSPTIKVFKLDSSTWWVGNLSFLHNLQNIFYFQITNIISNFTAIIVPVFSRCEWVKEILQGLGILISLDHLSLKACEIVKYFKDIFNAFSKNKNIEGINP
jgi:hypothetical protein